MATWVEEVIARLESSADGVMHLQVGGQSVVATLGPEFVNFFKENKAILLRMGLQTFKDFVTLLSEKRDEEAFNLLAERMDADDIIAKINMTAAQLKSHNDTRDKFNEAIQQFGMSLLTGAAAKIVLGLLL